MKVLLLVHGEVRNSYAASLMMRGHEVTMHGGGAIHGPAVKGYAECDGCLLIGSDPDLLEIADHMDALGKPIWRNLADVPKGP